ncbi:AzlD domain-containing protein [Actinophytocola xanthii]|uniref:AzlD domain-containing protein n=1 Tax=Actinophytocola xanthii TaxID=1912961 RepID=UPI000A99E55C|nr:AzlD domain-containing protein [Actinophytocola xanthii]
MTVTAILVLAVGTYAFRIAGPLLRARMARAAARRAARPEARSPVARGGEPEVGGGVAAEDAEVGLPPRVTEAMSTAATVLLVALIATAALTDGPSFAGVALPAGVVTGGVLAWRKAPFVVVVVAAAVVTAGLRALGVP